MPASYPTAVKTFTTKNAGDTIQPAHINDLQDEVVAIEQGLLGGVSPFQSSNSTLANLSVPGLSTFTGNVKMDGTLTVNKIVSTSISAAGVTSYVRGYAASTWSFSDTSYKVVPFNGEIADLLGEYDSTTYTFTPQSSGYYLITAHLYVAGSGNGGNAAKVVLGSTTTLFEVVDDRAGTSPTVGGFAISHVVNLSSGAANSISFRMKAASTGGGMSTEASRSSFEIIKLF